MIFSNFKWRKSHETKFRSGWSIWRSAVNGKEKFTLRLSMVRIGDFDTAEDAKAAVKFYEEGS